MTNFTQWLEVRQTMVMPASERPDVVDILKQAEDWAKQKKAEGWQKEDFLRMLSQIAPTLFDLDR